MEQSNDVDLAYEAEHLSLIFLSEVEKEMDKQDLKRSQLAEMLNTSRSYLTQLWRGDKVLNLTMIARMQHVLKIKFNITTTNDTTGTNKG